VTAIHLDAQLPDDGWAWPDVPSSENSDLPDRVERRAADDLAVRMLQGGAFILDAPKDVPAVWGEGEPLILAGPSGVGKTTLAQQLVLARLGLAGPVLGMRSRQERGGCCTSPATGPHRHNGRSRGWSTQPTVTS